MFFRVSLPIAWPAILSGLLLAWLRAFGEFGATVMVAYHPYSLPVYTYVAFGSQGLPAMLPVLLPTLALALAIMVLSTLARRHRRGARTRGCRTCPIMERLLAASTRNHDRRGRSRAATARSGSAVSSLDVRGRRTAAGSPSSDRPAQANR